MDKEFSLAGALLEQLANRTAKLGVIGMGYVGLPLAVTAERAGFTVTGFDIDAERVAQLNSGASPIRGISGAAVAALRAGGRFHATADFAELAEADAIMICVPTPLSRHREPDLSFIEKTGEAIARHLKRGQLIVLESTTYPGTTREALKPILEKTGLVEARDFFLAFSPEREDPGNKDFVTATIPRVVGADDPQTLRLVETLYQGIVEKVVCVSSTATAEAVKLTENIFRAVNIALVNELNVIYRKMGIDIWEVVDAAKTKPFGFMPFYPGPGLGGHCIPIDPFYLTWKAREYGVPTRFIELAGEINTAVPNHVVATLVEALSEKSRKSLHGARILLSGLAYKKNVDDTRESPSLVIFEMLEARGAKVEYYDPFVPAVPPTRQHHTLTGRKSIAWNKDSVAAFDAVVICTDHEDVDYKTLVEWSQLVVDTRNATRRVSAGREKIVVV